jgi:hypothetical protein
MTKNGKGSGGGTLDWACQLTGPDQNREKEGWNPQYWRISWLPASSFIGFHASGTSKIGWVWIFTERSMLDTDRPVLCSRGQTRTLIWVAHSLLLSS